MSFPEGSLFTHANSSATVQSQNKSKTSWEIEVQQKSKVSCN